MPHQKFFISFNSKDQSKADWVAWTLKEAQHEVAVHEWELAAGENIPEWMERRLNWADRMIAIVSPDYLTGTYSIMERFAVLWSDPEGKHGSIVPVLVRQTPDLPILLQPLKRIDLTGVEEEEAKRRLLEGVAHPRPPTKKPKFQPEPPPTEDQGPDSKPSFDPAVNATDKRYGDEAGIESEIGRRQRHWFAVMRGLYIVLVVGFFVVVHWASAGPGPDNWAPLIGLVCYVGLGAFLLHIIARVDSCLGRLSVLKIRLRSGERQTCLQELEQLVCIGRQRNGLASAIRPLFRQQGLGNE